MVDVAKLGDESAHVWVDARYFPLLVTTWVGAPSETQVRRYHDWLDEQVEAARTRGVQVVTVADAREADSPDATVRRLFAELADDAFDRHNGILHGHVAVLNNAVLRGALTAVSWMMRRGPSIRVEAELGPAIRKALLMLDQLGVDHPEPLPTKYVAPDHEDSVATPREHESSQPLST